MPVDVTVTVDAPGYESVEQTLRLTPTQTAPPEPPEPPQLNPSDAPAENTARLFIEVKPENVVTTIRDTSTYEQMGGIELGNRLVVLPFGTYIIQARHNRFAPADREFTVDLFEAKPPPLIIDYEIPVKTEPIPDKPAEQSATQTYSDNPAQKLLVAGFAFCQYNSAKRGLEEYIDMTYIDYEGASVGKAIYTKAVEPPRDAEGTITRIDDKLVGLTLCKIPNHWRYARGNRDGGQGFNAIYTTRDAKVYIVTHSRDDIPAWLRSWSYEGTLVEVNNAEPWHCYSRVFTGAQRIAIGAFINLRREQMPFYLVAERDGSAPVRPEPPNGEPMPNVMERRPDWLATRLQRVNPHTGELEAGDHGAYDNVWATLAGHTHNSRSHLMPCYNKPHPLDRSLLWDTLWPIAPNSEHVRAKNFYFVEDEVEFIDPNKSTYRRNGGRYDPDGIHPSELRRTGRRWHVMYTVHFGTAGLHMLNERWKRCNVTICDDDGNIVYATQSLMDFGVARTFLRSDQIRQIRKDASVRDANLRATHYNLHLPDLYPDNSRMDTVSPRVRVPFGRGNLGVFATNGAHRLNPDGTGSYNSAMSWISGQVLGSTNDINVNMPDPLRRIVLSGTLKLLRNHTWRGNNRLVYELRGDTLDELTRVQRGHTGTQFWFTHTNRDHRYPGATFSARIVAQAMEETEFVGDGMRYLHDSNGVYYTDEYGLGFMLPGEIGAIKQYVHPNFHTSLDKWNSDKPLNQCNPDTDWERYASPVELHNGPYVGRLVETDFTGVKNPNNAIKDTDVN